MTSPASVPDPPGDDAPEPEPLGAGIDWADPNSPLAPYYLGAAHLLGVVAVGLIALLYSQSSLEHTDIWAHVAYGRWMAAHSQLPDVDPLSPFADPAARGAYYPWLTQVAYHLAFQAGAGAAGADPVQQLAGGVTALLTLHVVLAAATYACLLVAFARAAQSPWLGLAGLAVVFAALVGPLGVQRPQLVGAAAFAAVLAALGRDVPSRRAVVWVPVLFALWANAHGSFPVGLALLGVVLVGRAIERSAAGDGVRGLLQDVGLRRLAAVLLLSGVAAMLTPYGPAVYPKVLAFGARENLATMAEWQPLNFSAPAGGHWLFLGVLVVLLVSQVASPVRIRTGPLAAVVVFGVWSLAQQRMMVWWVPVAVWAAVPCWRAALAGWGVPFGPPAVNFKLTVAAGLFAGAAVLALPAVRWLTGAGPRPIDQAVVRGTAWEPALALTTGTATPRSQALADALKGYPGGRFTGRVFASEVAGDFLVWALPAEWPVLMYTHAHVFPTGHWNDGLLVKAGGPGWWDVLDRHRANLVVVEAEAHPQLTAALRSDPRWKVVLDETGAASVPNPRHRLFVALRAAPLREGTP